MSSSYTYMYNIYNNPYNVLTTKCKILNIPKLRMVQTVRSIAVYFCKQLDPFIYCKKKLDLFYLLERAGVV